jgi:hypothetical protein
MEHASIWLPIYTKGRNVLGGKIQVVKAMQAVRVVFWLKEKSLSAEELSRSCSKSQTDITRPLTAAQSYNSKIPGYENLRFYCPHCHNVAVEAIKQRSFFTLCWVPLIPLGWGKKLHCTICNWSQDTNDSALANMAQQQQARH